MSYIGSPWREKLSIDEAREAPLKPIVLSTFEESGEETKTVKKKKKDFSRRESAHVEVVNTFIEKYIKKEIQRIKKRTIDAIKRNRAIGSCDHTHSRRNVNDVDVVGGSGEPPPPPRDCARRSCRS